MTTLLHMHWPRTLTEWVKTYSQTQWQGARLQAWVFEDADQRQWAQAELARAGVHARFYSAYKPLLYHVLENIALDQLTRLVLHYPTHATTHARRFALEAYPLAGLLASANPGCALELQAHHSSTHYTLELFWHDGRSEQQQVFVPTTLHTDHLNQTVLRSCGWLRLHRADGSVVCDQAVATEYEQAFDATLRCISEHAWGTQEPYFGRLNIRMDIPGIEQRLFVDQAHPEVISTTEAMHEELYFSLLEWFQRYGQRPIGSRDLRLGQIVPDIRLKNGDAHVHVELQDLQVVPNPAPAEVKVGTLHASASEPASDGALRQHPLHMDEVEHAFLRLCQHDGIERFEARTVQNRSVWGFHHHGQGPHILLSAGQHANETSGIIGGLRAAQVLLQQGRSFSFIPLENPDGYALQQELSQHTPEHMLHAARYTAWGDDVEYRQSGSGFERDAREQGVQKHGAQLHLNLHGYPAHEWTRPLTGYASRGFEMWALPKGFFLILRHHTGWGHAARQLLEHVARTLQQQLPELVALNRAQIARYTAHAGPLNFEVLNDFAVTLSEHNAPGSAPVTLITEYPDETLQGRAMQLAHTTQMHAVLAAFEVWESVQKPGHKA